MGDAREHVKIVFDLEPDEDGYPPVAAESLNAFVDGDNFVLDNTPFYVTGVALGDRVAATPVPEAPHRYRFERVLTESGAKAISIIFLRVEALDDVRTFLHERGCWCERGDRMLAVEIPAEVAYAPLRRHLMRLEAEETLSFAELAVASATPRFEAVHSVSDYCDQPRSGVADVDGLPHWFECRFDEKVDDHGDYHLSPLSAELAQLCAERDAIWRRWRAAFDAGDATEEAHPALAGERARYEALEGLLRQELESIAGFPAIAAFRRTSEAGGWEVAWTR